MRQVIKKRSTCNVSEASRPTGDVQAEMDQANGAQQPQTPGVRLVHVEGRVQAVEVTCRCGDVSVLEIEYEQ